MMMHQASNILECETLQYAAHRFPLHLHPYHGTFSLVLEGSAILVLPHKTYEVRSGQLVIIPPDVPHESIVKNHFSYQLIRTSVHLSGLADYLTTRQIITTDTAAVDRFNYWFRVIKEAPYNYLADAKMIQHTVSISEKMKLALSFMQCHFDTPIQLHHLSRAAMLSESHFQRLFKKQFSISPMRYLQSLRIDRAKMLIQQGTPMTKVAMATGFYDQSHFNKYFKQLAGMTPGNYYAVIEND